MNTFLRTVDATSLLGLGFNDREFLAGMRNPSSENTNLLQLQTKIDGIKREVRALGLPADLAKQLCKQLDGAKNSLEELRTDKPAFVRAMMTVPVNLLLGSLPFIVPLLSKPKQQVFASQVVGLSAKTAVEVLGMILSPSTGSGLVKNRLAARHTANVAGAVAFGPTLINPSKHVGNNLAFGAAATVFTVGVLCGVFLPNETRHWVNRRLGRPEEPKLAAMGRELSSEQNSGLHAVLNSIGEVDKALSGARDTFVEGGTKALSPHVGKQLQLSLGTLNRLAEDISHTLGIEPPQGDNPDRNAKLALTVFTAIVTLGTAGLMYPDKAGMVDLGADSAFTTLLMNSFVNNPSMSRADSLEEFKTFAGLSVVLLGLLAANKAAHNFIEKGLSGLLIGSVAITALNLTIPGIAGEYVGNGMAKAMDAVGPLMSEVNYRELPNRIANHLRTVDARQWTNSIGNQIYAWLQEDGRARSEAPQPSAFIEGDMV